MISIHAPPRGATSGGLTSLAGCRFQFTPLREGRQDGHPAGFRRPVYFNSRPSARGDEKRVNSRLLPFYFNSRPSARGDLGIPTVPCIRLISIHAPPRGATQKISKKCDLPLISIHAPPRGATPPVAILKNPVNISIHAPPRGATGGCTRNRLFQGFQFTPLREGRQPTSSHSSLGINFNSRPSARGDPLCLSENTTMDNFNSRPSARGDLIDSGKRNVTPISIHAPPRGATS